MSKCPNVNGPESTLKSPAGGFWSRRGDLIILALCARSVAEGDASRGQQCYGTSGGDGSNGWSVERDTEPGLGCWTLSYLADKGSIQCPIKGVSISDNSL